jgi:hypothetical protein
MTAPCAHEACFWAWVGNLAKDQGLAQAHESLDELLDAAHALSPVVQTLPMNIPTLRRLARGRLQEPDPEGQQP